MTQFDKTQGDVGCFELEGYTTSQDTTVLQMGQDFRVTETRDGDRMANFYGVQLTGGYVTDEVSIISINDDVHIAVDNTTGERIILSSTTSGAVEFLEELIGRKLTHYERGKLFVIMFGYTDTAAFDSFAVETDTDGDDYINVEITARLHWGDQQIVMTSDKGHAEWFFESPAIRSAIDFASDGHQDGLTKEIGEYTLAVTEQGSLIIDDGSFAHVFDETALCWLGALIASDEAKTDSNVRWNQFN